MKNQTPISHQFPTCGENSLFQPRFSDLHRKLKLSFLQCGLPGLEFPTNCVLYMSVNQVSFDRCDHFPLILK